MFEWDEDKSEKCRQLRGFGFEVVYEFDFASAATIEDDRFDYGERRFISFGLIEEHGYSIVWTPRPPNIRIISARMAHKKELKKYGL